MSLNQIENVKRCYQCNKKSLLELIERNNEYYIKDNCENGHNYLNNNKNSLNKIDCFECKKKQENNF